MLAFSGAAFGQVAEFWFSAGESLFWDRGLGSTDPVLGSPNDFQIGQDGFRFGFRFDLNPGDRVGYEMNYAYTRASLLYGGISEGFGEHTVSGDALYHFVKRDSRVRPFVSAGLGFSNFVEPGQSAAYGGGSNEFEVNYGGGVKVKAFSKWGHDWGFRVDLHQFQYFSKPFGLYFSNGKLQQTEISAGFGILF
ncbi:MAG TPA: hypothetical protein VMT15_03425 [Bryobacteraceae bacterium]|nr:hypothetical protein [Bryobacteraceae bacterium]